MRRLSCLSLTLRPRWFELLCEKGCGGELFREGGAQSARSWVMGTLGILGSKFLKILKLMGTLVGVDWGWSGWGWKVVWAHLLGVGTVNCQH
jgi:hypothetical protein